MPTSTKKRGPFGTSSTSKKKKKKKTTDSTSNDNNNNNNKKTVQQSLFSTKKQLQASLSTANVGKCILLPATEIYNGRVPSGEDEHLFKYHIKAINNDCETAVLAFDESYVLDGGHEFKNYPNLDEEEETEISNYSLSQLSQHHKLYNIHLGRHRTIINDKIDKERKAREAEQANEANSVSDLVAKFDNEKNIDAYQLLLAEFTPDGTLTRYTVEAGAHQGTFNYKQTWKHIHSGYQFTWHYNYGDGKNTFQKDRIWKAARYIVSISSCYLLSSNIVTNYLCFFITIQFFYRLERRWRGTNASR